MYMEYEENNMQIVIRYAKKRGASDIHITEGRDIAYRIDGSIVLQKDAIVTREEMVSYFESVGISKNSLDELCDRKISAIDASFEENGSRYRVNIYMTSMGLCAAIRSFYEFIPKFEDLNLPDCVEKFAYLKSGLVIITGVTGSGKSTTLASLIELINQTREDNIITIEDPIEYVYKPKKCRIVQREKGRDFFDFGTAVREAMRQDPDVILVGELRDQETIRNTITLAETGHLVFGTLHASSTVDAIDRLTDAFDSNEKEMMRGIVSDVIKGVVYQYLMKREMGGGRIPLCEVMTVDNVIKNALKENKKSSIKDRMRTSEVIGCVELVDRCVEVALSGEVGVDRIVEILDEDQREYFNKKLEATKEMNGQLDADYNEKPRLLRTTVRR